MLRHAAAIGLLLAFAVTMAVGQTPDATPPPGPSSPLSSRILKTGIEQNDNAPPADSALDPTTDQNWELQARSLAAAEEEARTGQFMGSPLCYRVTSVGDTDKSTGVQRITAMPIHSTTISADGTVDLGQLVEGSGDTMFVPPGTLQKGDLFTSIANQFVKVPANHFDALGTLADEVNKQVPADSPSALNNLANQLANAADAYRNNAGNFANDFLLAAGNVMGNTIQFLAQPRGNFGQLGTPAQQLVNYFNNDYNANDAKVEAAAQQAVQTLATHPGATLGNLFMAMLPTGQLGKDAEVAGVTQATQRLAAVENTASEFMNAERGLPPGRAPGAGNSGMPAQPSEPALPEDTPRPQLPPYVRNVKDMPSIPAKAALAHAKYPPGGPGIPEPFLPGKKTVNLDAGKTPPATVSVPGGAEPTAPAGSGGNPSALPPPSISGGGDTGGTTGSQGTGGPPTTPTRVPDRAAAPPVPPPPPYVSTPPSPLRSRQIAGQDASEAARQQALHDPPRTAPIASKAMQPTPITPAQRQAIADSVKKLQPALDKDAQWAGEPAVQSTLEHQGSSIPSAAPKPAAGAAPASGQADIVATLQSRFGSNPKDPLQGAPGLVESRFGIPTPATAASVGYALNLAGDRAQGLVFSQNVDRSMHVLNVRNNAGQVEFVDPATQQPVQLPASMPLYFYRTH